MTRATVLALQAGLCVVLVVAAGLVVRSFSQAKREWIPPSVDEILVSFVPFATASSGKDFAGDQRIEEFARTVALLPGAEQVVLSSNTPIQSAMYRQVFTPGSDSLVLANEPPIGLAAVSPGYLKMMGVAVVQGRDIQDTDSEGAALVTLVSERMARLLWPGKSPLGECLIVGRRTAPCRTVIGVVEDSHLLNLRERPGMRYYLPLAQSTDPFLARSIIVRARPGQASAVGAAMHRLAARDRKAGLPWTVTRYSEILEPELRPWRAAAVAFAGLAVLAGLIGSVGTYAMVAHVLTQRRSEIAVRRALGADAFSIAKLVALGGLRPVFWGAMAGALATLVLAGVARPLLYKVSAYDPSILAGTILLLGIATLFACVAPMRMALHIEPMAALQRD